MRTNFTDDQCRDGDFMYKKFVQWKHDPFLWMIEQVHTVDESDKFSPLKPFPPKLYLKLVLDTILQNKSTVICKSRRVMMTHLVANYLVHQLLFWPHSKSGIVSIGEDSARTVIEDRCGKTLELLDERIPFYPKFYRGSEILADRIKNTHNGAEIRAFPANPKRLRGFTMTNVFVDEMAFQDDVEKLLAALYPAIEGGQCRAILNSTPAFGTEFEKKVKSIREGSTVESLLDVGTLPKCIEEDSVITGLQKTMNAENEAVLFVHYTADPDKRSQEWYYKEKFGTTPDGKALPMEKGKSPKVWQVEYNLVFANPLGKRVVPEFSRALHCTPYKGILEGIPMEVSCDFGFHMPAVTFSQVDPMGRVIIHSGLMPEDTEHDAFFDMIELELNTKYAGLDFNLYGDPQGKTKNSQGSAPPIIKLLQDRFKKKVRHKYTRPRHRAAVIRNKMGKRRGDAMSIIVNPSAGTFIAKDGEVTHGIIVQAFEEGWIYKKNQMQTHYTDEDPYVDGFYVHLMDAFGYMMVCLYPGLVDDEARTLNQKTKLLKKRSRYLAGVPRI